MHRSVFSRLILYIILFAVAFGVTFGALCLGDKAASRGESESEEIRQTESEPWPPESDSQPAEEASTSEDADETESETAAETAAETPEPTPDEPHSITPPYHEEAAPDDYFADALFFGNSLLEGLGAYSLVYDENIAKASFDTATSMTIFGAADYINDAANGGYGKIYIGLGLNEIGYDREAIRVENEKAIDTIRTGNPDAIIYIFSLTPISSYRSSNDSLYNNTNAAKVSQVLREVAEEKECYFMDMVPVLGDSSGCLPSDVTADGVHFTREYYQNWYDYLEHNYVLP